jgi:peptide deformylase
MMSEEQPRNPIITPGDPERFPLLEMASQPCQIPITSADEQAIVDMDTILDVLDDEAAGIAAVQIGFPHRIFLLRNGTDEDGNATNNVYINPTIVSKSRKTKRGGEACLSLPGMSATFSRPKSVTLQFVDLDGEVQTETFDGFWARAVMHEMDHLNGTLITRHLEEQIAKQPRRTSFGMKVTPHRS